MCLSFDFVVSKRSGEKLVSLVLLYHFAVLVSKDLPSSGMLSFARLSLMFIRLLPGQVRNFSV